VFDPGNTKQIPRASNAKQKYVIWTNIFEDTQCLGKSYLSP